MGFVVRSLRFEDLDPRTHPFDREAVRSVVEPIVLEAVGGDPHRGLPASPWSREAFERALARALARDVGAWALGFTWSASEPGGGGPVRTYCCARDSLLRPDDGGMEATVARVVDSVADFHAFLVDLTVRFDALHARTSTLPLARSVEHAAAELLGFVLERTGAEDAWYQTFETAMRWYLEAVGHAPERARALVASAMSGRFESWVTPSEEARAEACSSLGVAVDDDASTEASERDAYAEWRRVRAGAFARFRAFGLDEPVRIDGHARYIDTVDRARGEERARRMREALFAVRDLARRNVPLTFARLCEVQALLLGVERVSSRSGDAFAKGGRERYPLLPDLAQRVERDLVEARDESMPVSARAARVYLDLAFSHPFDDGNARAARLALDYVLSREGRALHAAEPIFLLARAADDFDGAFGLAWAVEYASGRRGF